MTCSKMIFACALGFALSGCASTRMVQQSDLPQVTSKTPAVLVVRRSGSWVGGGLPIAVYDNNKKIGELGPSGNLTWRRDPGVFRLRVRAMEWHGQTIVGQTYLDLDDMIRESQAKSYVCGIRMPSSDPTQLYLNGDQPIEGKKVESSDSNNSKNVTIEIRFEKNNVENGVLHNESLSKGITFTVGVTKRSEIESIIGAGRPDAKSRSYCWSAPYVLGDHIPLGVNMSGGARNHALTLVFDDSDVLSEILGE